MSNLRGLYGLQEEGATLAASIVNTAVPTAKKLRFDTPIGKFRQYLRARFSLVWVISQEERRVEQLILEASSKEGYQVKIWDCFGGICDSEGKTLLRGEDGGANPVCVFDAVEKRSTPTVWVLRDLHQWLEDPVTLRGLKSFARVLAEDVDQNKFTTLVVLTAKGDVPEDLRSSAVVMDWPLPNREEIGAIVDSVAEQSKIALDPHLREDVLEAAAGLTAQDVEDSLALSISGHRAILPKEIAIAKKAIIDRDGLVQWYEPDPRGLDGLGGLGELRAWLQERRLAFSPEARAYGLPAAKGALLIGPAGTGKSLTAKCVATTFGLPLIRLDPGALKTGIVGGSEQNLRRVQKTVEAIRACVLWIDELEKAFAGAIGGGNDSGVSSGMLGGFLTWMQELALPIFFLGTSNDPTTLPPELISRFDETWFVGLPNVDERVEILEKSIVLVGRKPDRFNLREIAEATAGFSGRELNKLVGSSMFRAFADSGREVATVDLLEIAQVTYPVSKSAAETVSALERWAETRSRKASREVAAVRAERGAFGRPVRMGDDEFDNN